MAKIVTQASNTLTNWLSDFNSLSNNVGDLALLTTTVDSDIVGAINSIQTSVSTLQTQITNNDSDILALEGSIGAIDFSPYLKNDTAFTKTSGNVTFNDNIALFFGTGQDLRLRHDGINGYIDDIGTGSLIVRGTQILIRGSSTNENMIVATENGSAALYYDNAKKLETSATGVDVTGGIAVTGSAIISGVIGSDVDTQSMIVYGGNGTGGHIELYGGSHSTLANDINYDADQHNFRTQAGTATFTVDVSGNATATGTVAGADINSTSDARLKENVETVTNALDKVMNMRGVYFNRIGETERKLGVIAQEVEKIIPEVVAQDENGIRSVSYGNIVGLLIEAIRELKLEIDQLK